MGMKRRAVTDRKPVLSIHERSDSPRRTWQTKYQQIVADHNSHNGESEESSSSSTITSTTGKTPTSAAQSNNPLSGLLQQYHSDSDDDDDTTEKKKEEPKQLVAQVEDFMKEIQAISNDNATVGKPTHHEASPMQAKMNSTDGLQFAWQECYDEGTGYIYYWNMETNEVTWEMPEEYKAYVERMHWSLQAANNSEKAEDTTPKCAEKGPSKSKKHKSSDSEDEKIVMITSYGPSSGDDSDSDSDSDANVKPPPKRRKGVKSKSSHILNKQTHKDFIGPALPFGSQGSSTSDLPLGPQAPDQKSVPVGPLLPVEQLVIGPKLSSDHVEIGSQFLDDQAVVIGPPLLVDNEVNGPKGLEKRSESSNERLSPQPPNVSSSELVGTLAANFGDNPVNVDHDIDYDNYSVPDSSEDKPRCSNAETDSGACESSVPRDCRSNNSAECDASNSQSSTSEEESNCIDENEIAILSKLRSKAKILKELGGDIPEEVKQYIEPSHIAQIEKSIAEDVIAQIEQELPPDYKSDSCEAKVKASPVSAENSPRPTSFALIAGYGNDSDEESKSPIKEKKEKQMLFPIADYEDSNPPPQMSLAIPSSSKANVGFPKETTIPDVSPAVPEIPEDQPDSTTSNKAFQRKKQLGVELPSTSAAAENKKASSASYTTTWPQYNSDPASGDNVRHGFGFQGKLQNNSNFDSDLSQSQTATARPKGMIQFVKAETINLSHTKPETNNVPHPTDVKKEDESTKKEDLETATVPTVPTPNASGIMPKIEQVDSAQQQNIVDLAQVILEKINFLEQNKEQVSPLHDTGVQTETLFTAWQASALSSPYFLYWLQTTTAELAKHEDEATPQGWSCQWDRTYKRYYYHNGFTGQTQWEYPGVESQTSGVESQTSGEVATTSLSIPQPPRTPPPPMISSAKNEEDQFNPPPPPIISGDTWREKRQQDNNPGRKKKKKKVEDSKDKGEVTSTSSDLSKEIILLSSSSTKTKKPLGSSSSSADVIKVPEISSLPPLPPDDPPLPPGLSPPPPPEFTPPHPPLPADSVQPPPPGLEMEVLVATIPHSVTPKSTPIPPIPTQPLVASQFPSIAVLPPPPPPSSPPPPPDSTDIGGEPLTTVNSSHPSVAYALPAHQGSVVSSSSSGASGAESNSSLVYAASALPSHVIARPPARKDALRAELASFYSDLAFLEASGSIPQAGSVDQNGASDPVPGPSNAPEPEMQQPSRQEPEPSKKKKKTKLAPGLALKKKGVSSLVAKWQQVQQEVRRDLKNLDEDDSVSSTHK